MKYSQFLENYKNNKIIIKVDNMRASSFITSELANNRFKPAHYFWTYLAFFLIFIFPIILLFKFWLYSILSIFTGIIIYKSAKKSASQFVLENMLEDEKFCKFVLENKGAFLLNDNEEQITIS